MRTCRVCLRSFKKLRFDTGRVAICGRCVSGLNSRPAVAEDAQRRLSDMLERGIVRRATEALSSPDAWRRVRGQRDLDHLAERVAQALPGWLNRLLEDPGNSSRDFKLVRACRRHLLHFDRPRAWGYPNNWKDVASRVRALDDYLCTACGRGDRILDVHHIVYVFHFGTHRQENLATLCRECHEAEHGRVLDYGEVLGSDTPPTGTAVFADSERSADDEDSESTDGAPSPRTPAAPTAKAEQQHVATRGVTAPAAWSSVQPAQPAPPAPPVLVEAFAPRRSLGEAAWCILACHHCRRPQRVFVVGDDAVATCVFCKGAFAPGKLNGLRKAGW